MLAIACLLLLASFLMGLTGFYLALFAVALAIQLATGVDLLGSGGCAALGVLVVWNESALALHQTGGLAGVRIPAESTVAGGLGLAVAAFLVLVGVPWAVVLVPALTAGGFGFAAWRAWGDPRTASLSTLALMTDRGDCRYLRGLMLMIVVGVLLRRMVV